MIWLAQEATTWFGPLIPNHWKTIIILWYKMVIKEVYTIPTFSDISTNLNYFFKPNHFLFKLNFFFTILKTRLHFKIDCIIFVKNLKNVKNYSI
jgi:hypothetical protein